MTLADAPEPDVMLVVLAVVLTDPPETVTLFRVMAVIRVPAEETLPVVTTPSVRLAVLPVPTFNDPRLTDDSRLPVVITLARFVTVPLPLKLLFPPVTVKAVSVPPVRFRLPAELAVVIVPAEMLAVAPV